MPDITMCKNENCSESINCYRFRATPSEFNQAYQMFKPEKDNADGFYCSKYAEKEDWDFHEVSTIQCDLCNYSYVSVRPLGMTKLQCPNCGNVTTFENIFNQ